MMRVLIVSTIGFVRRSLEIWLAESDYKVMACHAYDQAVATLRGNPNIDLVITDWQLGKYTAFDIFKIAGQLTRVTDHRQVASVRMIILVTPNAQQARSHSQLNALKGLDQIQFLEKPLQRHLLLKQLDQVSLSLTPPPSPKRSESSISDLPEPLEQSLRPEVCLELQAEAEQAIAAEVSPETLEETSSILREDQRHDLLSKIQAINTLVEEMKSQLSVDPP